VSSPPIQLAKCETCQHRRGLHKGGGRCYEQECPCQAFAGELPEAVPATEDTGQGRLVSVIVPDGFWVTINLYPYTARDEEPKSD
jgi:hypothetical protein